MVKGAKYSKSSGDEAGSAGGVVSSVNKGEADQIVTPGYGRAYAKAMPTASFTLMPGAGHLPQVEAPEELLGRIWDLGQAQAPLTGAS